MEAPDLNRAVQLHRAGQFAGAEAIYRLALQNQPNAAEIHYNLATALKSQRKLADALASFREALQLRPNFPECWNNFGNVLRELHQPSEAINAYQNAIGLRPEFAEAWNNLGLAKKDTAQLDEALACFRRTSELQPENPAPASNRLCTIHFHADYDPAMILLECQSWNARFAQTIPGIKSHENDLSPDRRLRIGYISPDFRQHAQALFTSPLLSNHDHQWFEIYCYSDVAIPDGVTARLRAHADVWREIAGVADAAVAEQIRQDRIDILIDLTQHMAGNRLLVMARKPAPVQVSWLGYPGTTGLSAIDYRLTDVNLDPVGKTDAFYSERSIRVPDSFWCYDPYGMSESDDVELPEPIIKHTEAFTFGCLNNFCKVTPCTLALWARVLLAVPHSQLILLAPPGPHRQRLVEQLGLKSSEFHRVEFVEFLSRPHYLQIYSRIDLCLDTLPYNGHTTSLDALWMGTPVLTQIGNTVVGRAGASLLRQIGLDDFVTETDEDFVRKAVGSAANREGYQELRRTHRQRMESSPLMNGPRFAENIEAIYRTMWQAHVAMRS